MLAILTLRANQVVSREELIDGVWGDNPPAAAVGILYTYVWGLRHALEPRRGKQDPPTVLTSPGSGYALILDEDHIDERRFDRLRATAQRHWERGEPGLAIAELETALDLWHGEALAGLTGPAVELNRARLGESRLAAFERLAELKIVVGDNAGAVPILRDLVVEHPFREGLLALLMTALYRAGRRAEALDAYTNAQRVLVTELGIEPAPSVQRIHAKIMANEPVSERDFSTATATPPSAPHVRKGADSALPEPPAPPSVFVGRCGELAALRALVTGLAAGRGGCGWVDGAPGIGKSALLATALADVPAFGQRTVWLVGEQLLLRSPGLDGSNAIDPRLAGVDRTLALLERLCAETPVVLVVDDLQDTDEAGQLLWRRLTRLTQQLALVLIGACRTVPLAAETQQSRDAVTSAGGLTITIGPLDPSAVTELAVRRLGAAPTSRVGEYLDDALGNPSYLNELLDILLRARTPAGAGVAGAAPEVDAALHSALTRMVGRHLRFLEPETRDVLRWAALLGAPFDLGQVATVMHTSPAELVVAVEQAAAAGVLVATDRGFDFRNKAVARALYEERTATVRRALHREAAETLAAAGAPVEDVAAQLLAAAPAFDPWVLRWLLANSDDLGARDPFLAIELLDQAVALTGVDARDRERLAVRRVRWLFKLGRRPEAEARELLSTTADPEHAAEMRWVLAQLIHDAGHPDVALADLRDAERNPSVPDLWKARYKILRARFERTGLDDLRTAARTATAALDEAMKAADPVAISAALQELWYLDTIRRDHGSALAHVDRAIAATAGVTNLARWQLHLLDNRAFTLQNLDRLDEASDTLARTRALSTRLRPPAGRHHITTAVHCYWLGRWDDALAEISAVTGQDGRGNEYLDARPRPTLLELGVAALIAAQRGDTEALRAHLRAADDTPVITVGDQESSDFLVMARAIDAGGRGGVEAELAELDVLLDLRYGRATLRHQWLPALVRLAMEAGDRTRLKAALDVARSRPRWRTRQPAPTTPLPGAVAWWPATRSGCSRSQGTSARSGVRSRWRRPLWTLRRRRPGPARWTSAARTFGEAVAVLTGLGAAFDIERAVRRMNELGVRRDGAGISTVARWWPAGIRCPSSNGESRNLPRPG